MRDTETKFLVALSNPDADMPVLLKELVDKVQKKGQSARQAVKINDLAEQEFNNIMALFTGGAATQEANDIINRMSSAIKNYTMDSSSINRECRTRKGDQSVQGTIDNLDMCFTTLGSLGANLHERITYRIAAYRDPNDMSLEDDVREAIPERIPYGAPAQAAGKSKNQYAPIVANDMVADLGYISASLHRQFILNKMGNNKKPNVKYVHFTLVGKYGINISGYSFYNAQTMRTLDAHKNFIAKRLSPSVGQAEILYPRATIFQVASINPVSATQVDVVLESTANRADVNPGNVKDMFSGLPVKVAQVDAHDPDDDVDAA